MRNPRVQVNQSATSELLARPKLDCKADQPHSNRDWRQGIRRSALGPFRNGMEQVADDFGVLANGDWKNSKIVPQ
jgi:hypothetical protein